jgi:hypothetical protein
MAEVPAAEAIVTPEGEVIVTGVDPPRLAFRPDP